MPQVETAQLSFWKMGPDMARIREALAASKRVSRSRNTHKAYDSDWRGFEQWCVAAGRPYLPTNPDTVLCYIVDKLESGMKASSANRHLAAIAFRHKADNLQVPDRKEARAYIVTKRRERQEQPRKRAPLRPDDLRKICLRCLRLNTPGAMRDRALLLFGVKTALRQSNIVEADFSHLAFVPEKGYAVLVPRSKTDQNGKGKLIGVRFGKRGRATCPVAAMEDWLKHRGREPGPLFTRVRVDRGGNPRVTKSRLKADYVNTLVKLWVKAIGLDPNKFGSHSIRSTFVTTAHNEGTDALGIMEVTGHTTMGMVKEYLRNVDPFAGPDPLGRAL